MIKCQKKFKILGAFAGQRSSFNENERAKKKASDQTEARIIDINRSQQNLLIRIKLKVTFYLACDFVFLFQVPIQLR